MHPNAPKGETKLVHYLADSKKETLCGIETKTDGTGPWWVPQKGMWAKKEMNCKTCKQLYTKP